MQSYTSQRAGVRALFREARNLYRSRLEYSAMDNTVAGLRRMERLLVETYGFRLEGRDILDIGSGQIPVQLYYLARCNRATGIDTDVIVRGFNPIRYLEMLALNGPRRTIKTIARKVAGIDRLFLRELKKKAGLESMPKPAIHRMDACRLSFPDASFDFVHCSSVFHHLPDPAAALEGIVRVLRPGGALYITLHLFTSETGSLDPRVLTGPCGEIPAWAHLRNADGLLPNAFLNRWRLPRWRNLFSAMIPGSRVIPGRTERAGIEEEARALIDSGVIQGYDIEELVTNHLTVLWQKP